MDINIFEDLYNIASRDIKEVATLVKEYQKQDFATQLGNANTAIQTHTNSYKELQKEKLDVYNHYADVLNQAPKAEPKKKIGTGSFEVTLSDGSVHNLPDAFGGPQARPHQVARPIPRPAPGFHRGRPDVPPQCLLLRP